MAGYAKRYPGGVPSWPAGPSLQKADYDAWEATLYDLRTGHAIYAKDFPGGTWDGTADDYPAIQAAIDAVAAGVKIILPPVARVATKLIVDNKPVGLVGSVASNPLDYGSLLKAAAGVSAIEIRNGTNGRGARSFLERLHIQGSDSAPGSNDGVLLRANSAIMREVVVESFGGSGAHILSGQDGSPFVGDGTHNANLWRLRNVRLYNNKTHGLFVEGIDASAGDALGLDCTGNTGWGVYEKAAFGSCYWGPHFDGNALGAIRIGDQNGDCRFMGVYKEGDSTPALQIDAGGKEGNIVDFRVYVGNVGETIVDNTAGKENTITKNGRVPRARVYKAAAQSCASGAFTSIPFDNERYDTDAIHDNATNNTRLTAKTPGVYRITGHVELAQSAVGVRYCRILLNGATEIARVGSVGTGDVLYFNPSVEYPMAAGDYVELQVYQNSGGALNANAAGNYSPEFSMVRVS